MRKSLFLSAFLMSLIFTVSADSFPPMPSVCDFAVCYYLPLIRQDIKVNIYEVDEKVGRDSGCWFLGDVMTNAPVRDVVVEVRYLGDDQKFSDRTLLEASLPGQLNPFRIRTPLYHPCPSAFEAHVISVEVGYERVYRNATIVSITTSEVPFSGTNVTVEIRNDEARPLLDVRGVIWSIDMTYSPNVLRIAASLAPGEAVTFSALLFGAYYEPLIHVSAQGYLQP